MLPITCIEDLRRLYLKRVPQMFVDYCESGSWTETTLHRNLEDFASIQLHQRVALGVEGGTTSTRMLGADVALPVALAPVGLCGMQHASVLVPVVRDARPRFHRQPDRPRQGRGLLGAGADAGPAGDGPAPP